MILMPCKFQTSSTGTGKVLIYSEDRKSVYAIAEGDQADVICETLSMPKKFGKCFAMASINSSGQIAIGDVLPDQGW